MSSLARWLGNSAPMVRLGEFLQSTQLSFAMRDSVWLWPLCETLHFVGLTCLVGVIGLMDLRLLGVVTGIRVGAIRKLIPFAVAGFALNLLTGVAFYAGAPGQYQSNIAWYLKLLFMAIAGLNVAFFELRLGREIDALPADAAMPARFKLVGAVSLVSWAAVLYFGRMLPFIGDAF